jgi:signal peptidase I
MRNYAEARLLNKEELKQQVIDTEGVQEGILYLQLHHTPSLNFPKPLLYRENGHFDIAIPAYSTIIPLQQHHLKAIMDNLYTARFVVSKGKATRYILNDERFSSLSPSFPNVPDGTYEFYFGKATRIIWGGGATAVPANSPLYSPDSSNVQKLFNMGIEMNLAYAPSLRNQTHFPHRYAYFRNGDLYLMGAPIIKKEDPTLIDFHRREEERQTKSTKSAPYVAFKDYGPPLKDDKLEVNFIRAFGITIPDGLYLVLGDNHAMSADSRVFGFVPANNLQGAPCWIIWPPDRLGTPPQKPYPLINFPRTIVWCVGLLIALFWYIWHRIRLSRPIFVKRIQS